MKPVQNTTSPIINFISELLSDIISHRNHLKHRNCHSDVHNFHDNCIIVDADFAENISVPVKIEPQSMHWSHQQVTIHSGITKFNGEKSYHPYFSDDRSHDFYRYSHKRNAKFY